MTLMLRDPFTEPFRLMDDLFTRAWGGDGNRVTGWVPPLDLRESGDEYVVWLDLPGVKSDDVSIELNGNVLSISGTRVPVETGAAQRVERPYGSFVRMLTLPKGIDAEKIVADYHDGVLELHVPKPAGIQAKKIAIGSGSQQKAIEA